MHPQFLESNPTSFFDGRIQKIAAQTQRVSNSSRRTEVNPQVISLLLSLSLGRSSEASQDLV